MSRTQRYTSPAWMERERRGLWPAVWLYACPSLDVADHGQRALVALGRESVVVVRGEDGRLRAFHNVCPHRGHPLCDGPGTGPFLRCPYHQWTFGLDGALSHRPLAEQYPDEEVRLREVRCAELGGLVWIALSPEVPDLRAYLGPVAEAFEAYRVGEMTLANDQTMPLACNWKASVDVHNESVHVRFVHPQALPIVDVDGVRITSFAPHARMVVPFREGAPGDQGPDNHMFYVFPNLQLNCYRDALMLFRHRPHPTDPGRCWFDQQIFQRRGQPHRQGAHQLLVRGQDSLGPVTDADLDIVERLQRGMASSGVDDLILGAEESCIAGMHAELDRMLGTA